MAFNGDGEYGWGGIRDGLARGDRSHGWCNGHHSATIIRGGSSSFSGVDAHPRHLRRPLSAITACQARWLVDRRRPNRVRDRGVARANSSLAGHTVGRHLVRGSRPYAKPARQYGWACRWDRARGGFTARRVVLGGARRGSRDLHRGRRGESRRLSLLELEASALVHGGFRQLVPGRNACCIVTCSADRSKPGVLPIGNPGTCWC